MEDLNKYLDNIGEKRDTLRHYLLKTHAECKFTCKHNLWATRKRKYLQSSCQEWSDVIDQRIK